MIKILLAAAGGLVLVAALVLGLFWRSTGDAYEMFGPLPSDSAAVDTPSAGPAEAADSSAVAAEAAVSVPSDGLAESAADPGVSEPGSGGNRLSEAEKDALSAEIRANGERFGRMFASMKPADAVEILAHLPDDAVRGILSLVPGRTAAEILSRMPADRAAHIAAPLVPTLTVPIRP